MIEVLVTGMTVEYTEDYTPFITTQVHRIEIETLEGYINLIQALEHQAEMAPFDPNRTFGITHYEKLGDR